MKAEEEWTKEAREWLVERSKGKLPGDLEWLAFEAYLAACCKRQERIGELEASLAQERKDKNAWLIKYQGHVRQLQTSHDAHMDIASKRINQAESEVKRLEASVRELQDANNNLNEFMLKHCPNLKRT